MFVEQYIRLLIVILLVFVVTSGCSSPGDSALPPLPVELEVVGTFETMNSPSAIAVADELVYLGHEESLLIVNARDPQRPVQLSETPLNLTNDMIQDIHLAENIAAVLTEEHLYLLDVRNPIQPIVLSHINVLQGIGAAVKIQGTSIYVLSITRRSTGGIGGMLAILDMRDNTKPEWKGSYVFAGVNSGFSGDMYIRESHIYIAAFEKPVSQDRSRPLGLLHILDIQESYNPTLLAELPLVGKSATDVAVVADQAYVAMDWDWYQHVDVQDLHHPVALEQYRLNWHGVDRWEPEADQVHTFVPASSVRQIEAHNNLLYTTGTRQVEQGGAAVRIIDIRDPIHPRIAGGRDFPGGTIAYTQVESDTIYVALDYPSGHPGELHMLQIKK